MQPASNFYMSELSHLPEQRQLRYDKLGAWIVCPNPQHSGGNERSGSLKVTVESGRYQGSFYCFGCGIGGGWNKLAAMLGMKKVSNGAKSAHTTFSFKKFEQDDVLPDFKKMIPWPATKEWRGIGGKTLVKFNTKVEQRRDRIQLYFPVSLHGEEQGYIRANQEKPKRDPKTGKKEANYFNMPGDWASGCLFGYDLAMLRARKRHRNDQPVVVWVVEGPRDVMNVAQHGGIVVGLIGSAPTAKKLQLILELDPDVVLIATDPDDAGHKAARQLLRGKIDDNSGKRLFDGLGALISCIRVNFKEGRDPADLTRPRVKRLEAKAEERL